MPKSCYIFLQNAQSSMFYRVLNVLLDAEIYFYYLYLIFQNCAPWYKKCAQWSCIKLSLLCQTCQCYTCIFIVTTVTKYYIYSFTMFAYIHKKQWFIYNQIYAKSENNNFSQLLIPLISIRGHIHVFQNPCHLGVIN